MSGWSRSEKISIALLIIGALSAAGTWLTLPGIRSYVPSLLGLEAGDRALSRDTPAARSPRASVPPTADTDLSSPLLQREEWSLFDQRSTAGTFWPSADSPATGFRMARRDTQPVPARNDRPVYIGEEPDRRVKLVSGTGSRPNEREQGPGEKGRAKTASPAADTPRAGPFPPERDPGETGGEAQEANSGAGAQPASGAAQPESRSSVQLRPEGPAELEFRDATCTAVGNGVRCRLTVANPTSSAVSVTLVRESGSKPADRTYLAFPDGRRHGAAAIEFGGFRAAGPLAQLAPDQLEPGGSSRAELIFPHTPGDVAEAELHLRLIREGEPPEVWLR